MVGARQDHKLHSGDPKQTTRYNIDFLPLILATDELDLATEPPPGNVEQFDCLFYPN